MSDPKISGTGFLYLPKSSPASASAQTPEMKELRDELKSAVRDGKLTRDEELAVAQKLGKAFDSIAGDPDRFEAVAAGVQKLADSAGGAWLSSNVCVEQIERSFGSENPSIQKLVESMRVFLSASTTANLEIVCSRLPDAFHSLGRSGEDARLLELLTSFSGFLVPSCREQVIAAAQSAIKGCALSGMVDDIFGVDPSER